MDLYEKSVRSRVNYKNLTDQHHPNIYTLISEFFRFPKNDSLQHPDSTLNNCKTSKFGSRLESGILFVSNLSEEIRNYLRLYDFDYRTRKETRSCLFSGRIRNILFLQISEGKNGSHQFDYNTKFLKRCSHPKTLVRSLIQSNILRHVCTQKNLNVRIFVS
jgi:hypothetical protein